MANTDSTEVTNLLADPSVRTPVGQWGGRVRVAMGNFEVATSDLTADNDTVRLTRLPANARPLAIWIGNDDLESGGTTASAVNIGLFEPTATPAVATAADEDCFATASAILQAATVLGSVNLLDEAGAGALANVGDPLYTWAGDSAGDFAEYDIVITQTATTSNAAAGTIAYVIEYTID
jgi:hypothetical protein